VEYFEILELEPRLSLDAGELQRRFYTLSRKYHPDRNPGELDKSALLNNAFRTLRDPVSRAQYVVESNGLDINSRDVPPELLEEVFEFNMALEESDRDELLVFRGRFSALLEEIDAGMKTEFARWDAERSGAALERIRSLLNRRKYISNLVRTIDQNTNGNLPN
jgi:molecular chaperone HscB